MGRTEPADARSAHSQASLTGDLVRLGVHAGDMLFVHSSLKSLGRVEGGPLSVLAALGDALGPEGLLLMPSFNLVERDRRAQVWDIASTPSTVGCLTECFRKMPATVRSDHYSHSVAARGCGAEEFVDGHLSLEGLESPWDLTPWGRTFGSRSPFVRACDRGAKLLMLGVDYESATFVHLVETLWWSERRAARPDEEFVFLDRPGLGRFWDGQGRMSRGRVGDADSRLFSIPDFVGTLLNLVRQDPLTWVKKWNKKDRKKEYQ